MHIAVVTIDENGIQYYCSMMKTIVFLFLNIFLCTVSYSTEIVINELHYNPPDDGLKDGSYREFVELYNPHSTAIDLSDFRFVEGIFFTFPSDTRVAPNSYLVIARDPAHRSWRHLNSSLYGPYEGKLANQGETIALERSDGQLAFRFEYSDTPPWPLGADGYGSSMERIDWELPASDYHSWRASHTIEGTPGKPNSVLHESPRPLIEQVSIIPSHPTSKEEVYIQVRLDTTKDIEFVDLHWERAGENFELQRHRMAAEFISNITTFQGIIPPLPSQTLVRCNIEVKKTDGQVLRLPPEAEPIPFYSYFLYDGEIESRLPILWVMHPVTTHLLHTPRPISGVVSLLEADGKPAVFDGAQVRDSHNGNKVRFIKGREYFGDRTINLIPETPVRGTNPGSSAPFREHLGFWFYQEMNILSPWAKFYRVITLPRNSNFPHAQRLVIQQVNERFLMLNDRSPDGDLYKRVYSNPNWEKHTNMDEGTNTIEELVQALQTEEPAIRRYAMENRLVLEEFLRYSIASVLTSNWDGFWNNNWMVLHPGPFGRWEIIPWDLDWLWGSTTQEMYAEMPTTFPIDGVAVGAEQASRPSGPITAPLHRDTQFHQKYILGLRRELNRHFTEKKLFGKIDEMERLLLDDLQKIEQETGRNISTRKRHIHQAYTEIKEFITRRIEYLNRVLPVEVHDWQIHE